MWFGIIWLGQPEGRNDMLIRCLQTSQSVSFLLHFSFDESRRSRFSEAIFFAPVRLMKIKAIRTLKSRLQAH